MYNYFSTHGTKQALIFKLKERIKYLQEKNETKVNTNLHALSPDSTPIEIGTEIPRGDIILSNADNKQVLRFTTDENKKIICKWGEDAAHLINLNYLEDHLKDLISPDLRKAIIRELKLKMNDAVKEVAKGQFSLNEE